MRRYLCLLLGHLLPLSSRRFLLVEVKLCLLFGPLQGLLPPVVLCSVLSGLTDALEHLGPLLGVLQSYGLHRSLVRSRREFISNKQHENVPTVLLHIRGISLNKHIDKNGNRQLGISCSMC